MKILDIYNKLQTRRLLKKVVKRIHNTTKIGDIVYIREIANISTKMFFKPSLDCNLDVMRTLFLRNDDYQTFFITHDKTLFSTVFEALEYMKIHEVIDEQPYTVFKRIN